LIDSKTLNSISLIIIYQVFSGDYRGLDHKLHSLKINSRERGNAWQESDFCEKEVKDNKRDNICVCIYCYYSRWLLSYGLIRYSVNLEVCKW